MRKIVVTYNWDSLSAIARVEAINEDGEVTMVREFLEENAEDETD